MIGKVIVEMSQRDTNLLWLRDLLDQLRGKQQQLGWAENPETIRILTENMLRDLECCRRLCESLNRRASLVHADS